MAQRKDLLFIVSSCLVCLFMAGCGGGSSSPPPPPMEPSFTLALSPTSVAVSQGGTSQMVQVSVTGQNGFTGTVTVTLANLPAGVTASPSSLSISSGQEAGFDLSASSNAQVGQQDVSVNGVSGTTTADASLQITVMSVVVQDPYHAVGGSLVHGFYDEPRQLLFATNPGLNELDVFSGLDYSLKARIPVPQPWGIDQMADGKTLVLGTQAQEIVTVDEDTYAVTQHPYAAVGAYSPCSLWFPMVVALANGEVLMIGLEQGIESDNIYEAGQYLYQWASTTNAFSQLEPTAQNSLPSWEVDSLARSADHKWAVFAADQFYLYSSDSSSLTAVPVNTVNPPQDEYGIRGYALNADGSKIAVASAYEVTFFDRSFTTLGSATLPAAFQTARSAIQFSSDGSKLFLEYALPLALVEIDASSYTALGYLSATVDPDDDNLEILLTTDAEGRAYFGINEGLRIVQLSQTPVPMNSASFPGPTCPSLNAELPLNQSQQMTLLNQPTNIDVYIGGQPATLTAGQAGLTEIAIPASPIAGPADIECVDSSGDTAVVPAGVSYGVDPAGFSANLLPPTGNPPGYLFGYGFFTTQGSQGPAPSITLGGQTVTSPLAIAGYGLGTLEGEGFRVPNGTAGDLASIQVSSSLGSGTLTSVATYYPSPTIVPASGLLQIIYDSHRDVIYALKATEVDVLNLTTLQWQSPMVFPSGATGPYTAMALSPDGSKLVVAGIVPNTTNGTYPQLIVFNPGSGSPGSLFTYAGNSSVGTSIAITNSNAVVMIGGQGLVFDLSSLAFTQPPNLFAVGSVIRASADGSHLYAAALNSNNGEVFSIDPSTYAVQYSGYGYLFWSDLAVSPDGTQIAAVNAPPYATGSSVGFFDSGLHYLNSNVYPDFSPPDDIGVIGAAFSPAGKVLVVPLGDSLEIWDTATGTLRARLMTPEELQVITYPENGVAPLLAMDSAGQTIFAVSASGLTVLTLPEPLDQIPAAQWQAYVRPGNHKNFVYGSITARMKAMRSKLRN